MEFLKRILFCWIRELLLYYSMTKRKEGLVRECPKVNKERNEILMN